MQSGIKRQCAFLRVKAEAITAQLHLPVSIKWNWYQCPSYPPHMQSDGVGDWHHIRSFCWRSKSSNTELNILSYYYGFVRRLFLGLFGRKCLAFHAVHFLRNIHTLINETSNIMDIPVIWLTTFIWCSVCISSTSIMALILLNVALWWRPKHRRSLITCH